jgi:hypothetical protein
MVVENDPADVRTKNIEAVKALLSPEEWDEVKEAAYAERKAGTPKPSASDTQAAALAQETLASLKSLRYSIGRLYGHFNNVMRKWNITPLNSFNKPAAEVPLEPEPPKDKPEPPPVKKPTPVPPAPKPPKRRVSVKRELAPPEEVKWRRELAEKQLKLRPSSLGEIIARLKADGFPVNSPYYSAKTSERKDTRLRTLISADLYLLMFNRVVLRTEAGLYKWIPNNGVKLPYASRTATIIRERKKN